MALKKIEYDWAKTIEQGKKVEVDIRPVFRGDSKRPIGFKVQYKINDEAFNQTFKN